jgi:hypothetical protein
MLIYPGSSISLRSVSGSESVDAWKCGPRRADEDHRTFTRDVPQHQGGLGHAFINALLKLADRVSAAAGAQAMKSAGGAWLPRP